MFFYYFILNLYYISDLWTAPSEAREHAKSNGMVRNSCEVSRAVNMVSTPRHRCQHFTNLSTNTVITPDKVSTHTHWARAVKTLAKSPLRLQWLRIWRDLDFSLDSIIWSAYSGWWQLAAVHLNWFHTAHQLVIVGLTVDNGESGYYIRNRLDSTLDFDRHLWYLASKPH